MGDPHPLPCPTIIHNAVPTSIHNTDSSYIINSSTMSTWASSYVQDGYAPTSGAPPAQGMSTQPSQAYAPPRQGMVIEQEEIEWYCGPVSIIYGACLFPFVCLPLGCCLLPCIGCLPLDKRSVKTIIGRPSEVELHGGPREVSLEENKTKLGYF